MSRRINALFLISFVAFLLISLSVGQKNLIKNSEMAGIRNLDQAPSMHIQWTEISGNWVVSGTEIRKDEVIVLTGNLTIESGGKLVLSNVTLQINSSYHGEFGITVEAGGELQILNDSYIKSYIDVTETHYFFVVEPGAKLLIKDSSVYYCGYNKEIAPGLWIKANDSYIENTVFAYCYYGIVVGDTSSNPSFTVTNVTIKSNFIHLCNYGVLIYNSANIAFIRNTIMDNTFNGVQVWLSSGMKIINNTFVHDGLFIFDFPPFQKLADYEVSGNKVNGKPIYYLYNVNNYVVPKDAGSVIVIGSTNVTIMGLDLSLGDNSIELVGCQNVLIADTIMDNGTAGVVGFGCNGLTIKGNRIRYNLDEGIALSSCQNVLIRNNILSGNIGFDPHAIGLQECVNVLVTYNEITNNFYGILVQDGGSNINITMNNIYTNGMWGLYTENFNDENVSALFNWWGSPDGANYTDDPDSGDPEEVYGNVTYSPWLTSKLQIIVDGRPPELIVISPTPGSYVNQIVDVSAEVSDPESGVQKVVFYINGELVHTDTEAPYRYTWNTTQYDDGQYTIEIRAYDNLDNVNSTTFVVTVDNTGPEIGEPSISPSQPTKGESINITVSVNDAGCGVKNVTLWYRVGTGDWVSVQMTLVEDVWQATIPGQAAGSTIEYYIEAYDNLGNRNVTSVYSFNVGGGQLPFGLNTTVVISTAVAASAVVAIILLVKRRR